MQANELSLKLSRNSGLALSISVERQPARAAFRVGGRPEMHRGFAFGWNLIQPGDGERAVETRYSKNGLV